MTLRDSLPSANDVFRQVGLELEHPAPSMLTAAAAFALGAVTGAVLAVLFTPRAGGALRQTLRQRLRAWRELVAAPANGDELPYSSGAAKPVLESATTRG